MVASTVGAVSALEHLTAGDVMHREFPTLSPSATIADLRAYFAADDARRLALVVEGKRFIGSISRAEVPADGDGGRTVIGLVRRDPLAWVFDSAKSVRDKALAHPSRRVPVIDGTGGLAGIFLLPV